MSRAELAAHRCLRVDAVYCAGAGVVALALCPLLGRFFHVPPAAAAAIGSATRDGHRD